MVGIRGGCDRAKRGLTCHRRPDRNSSHRLGAGLGVGLSQSRSVHDSGIRDETTGVEDVEGQHGEEDGDAIKTIKQSLVRYDSVGDENIEMQSVLTLAPMPGRWDGLLTVHPTHLAATKTSRYQRSRRLKILQ